MGREKNTANHDLPAAEASGPEAQAPSEERLRPWQFSLKGLLASISLLSLLFAAMSWIGSPGSWLLGWLGVMIAAHVGGNLLSGRFRAGHRTQQLPPYAARRIARRPIDDHPQAWTCPPATRLREPGGPGWTAGLATAAGGSAGGTIGFVLLASVRAAQHSLGGLVIGTLSAVVVGAFIGYLTSSFLTIACQAWAEAARSHYPEAADLPEERQQQPD